MNEDKIRFAVLKFERLLDNLEFMQKVMELYDIPEPIATKLTESHCGLCEEYEKEMLELLECANGGMDTAMYLDTQDKIRKAQ